MRKHARVKDGKVEVYEGVDYEAALEEARQKKMSAADELQRSKNALEKVRKDAKDKKITAEALKSEEEKINIGEKEKKFADAEKSLDEITDKKTGEFGNANRDGWDDHIDIWNADKRGREATGREVQPLEQYLQDVLNQRREFQESHWGQAEGGGLGEAMAKESVEPFAIKPEETIADFALRTEGSYDLQAERMSIPGGGDALREMDMPVKYAEERAAAAAKQGAEIQQAQKSAVEKFSTANAYNKKIEDLETANAAPTWRAPGSGPSTGGGHTYNSPGQKAGRDAEVVQLKKERSAAFKDAVSQMDEFHALQDEASSQKDISLYKGYEGRGKRALNAEGEMELVPRLPPIETSQLAVQDIPETSYEKLQKEQNAIMPPAPAEIEVTGEAPIRAVGAHGNAGQIEPPRKAVAGPPDTSNTTVPKLPSLNTPQETAAATGAWMDNNYTAAKGEFGQNRQNFYRTVEDHLWRHNTPSSQQSGDAQPDSTQRYTSILDKKFQDQVANVQKKTPFELVEDPAGKLLGSNVTPHNDSAPTVNLPNNPKQQYAGQNNWMGTRYEGDKQYAQNAYSWGPAMPRSLIGLHELEHVPQGKPTIEQINAAGMEVTPLSGVFESHPAARFYEPGAVMGEFVNAADAARTATGAPVQGRVSLAPGYEPKIDWMRQQAQQHGYAPLGGDKNMTQLLNTPAGQAWSRMLLQHYADAGNPKSYAEKQPQDTQDPMAGMSMAELQKHITKTTGITFPKDNEELIVDGMHIPTADLHLDPRLEAFDVEAGRYFGPWNVIERGEAPMSLAPGHSSGAFIPYDIGPIQPETGSKDNYFQAMLKGTYDHSKRYIFDHGISGEALPGAEGYYDNRPDWFRGLHGDKPRDEAKRAAESQSEKAIKEANDKQLSMLEPISQMGMEATVPGSIYTHDIHLEKLLPELLSEAGPDAMKNALDKVGAISGSINAKDALKEEEFAARSKDVAKSLEPKLPTPIDEGAWMKKGVEERVKNPSLDALQDALLLDSGKAISSASGSMNLTGAKAPQIGEENLFTSMERTSSAMDAMSAALATPVGQHAVPVLRSEEDSAGDVQPVHLRDITDSILREKTSAQAGTGKLQSDELTRLEVVANQQVAELVEIKKGINKMVDLLTPTGGGAGVVGSSEAASKGSTKDPKNPLRASRYGLMKYLTPGDIGDRIMVNNGEVC
jgi:hypothetical protein